MSVSGWQQHPTPTPHCLQTGLYISTFIFAVPCPCCCTSFWATVYAFPLLEHCIRVTHMELQDLSRSSQVSSRLWSFAWMISNISTLIQIDSCDTHLWVSHIITVYTCIITCLLYWETLEEKASLYTSCSVVEGLASRKHGIKVG